MPLSWDSSLITVFRTLYQILTAGVAITAFALLLYALTFNLQDRVARSFAMIMFCVVVVFTAEALGSTASDGEQLLFWLQFQWAGIIFLPPVYLHFSDALLTITGRPSRGRRRWLVRLTYAFSTVFLIILAADRLFGDLVTNELPAPHLSPTPASALFTLYYGAVMVIAGSTMARAYLRTVTSSSRRRMIYLLAGATAPALGSYPYLLFGSGLFTGHPLLFWVLATFTTLIVGGLIVVMAYAVAFFGVSWPDRVVKSRLFKWLLRGPVTASFVLGLVTIVRRAGAAVGEPYPALVPIVMVAMILLMEYTITLLSPVWERLLFYGKDRVDAGFIEDLSDRMLTRNDLKQFLELVVSTVCDRVQSPGGFVSAINSEGFDLVVTTGDNRFLKDEPALEDLAGSLQPTDLEQESFRWDGYLVIPLNDPDSPIENRMLGLMGYVWWEDQEMDEEQDQALAVLTERATLALKDWQIQQQIMSSLKQLTPQMDLIQQLRAASRYDRSSLLLGEEQLQAEDLNSWVKDALGHYWGGPKLTQSPLLQLKIVKDLKDDHEGSEPNALRAVLRKAIEQVRPEGERRFTGEWILYNILEMKFLEGRKVREVAMRLAMSEADLYRKQRVAIEAVAKAIVEMEKQAQEEVTH